MDGSAFFHSVIRLWALRNSPFVLTAEIPSEVRASMGDGDAAGMVIATLTSTKLSMDARSLFMRSLGTMRVGQLVASSIEEQGVAVAEPFDRHLKEILGEEGAGAVRWVLRWADDESDLDAPELDDESSSSSDT